VRAGGSQIRRLWLPAQLMEPASLLHSSRVSRREFLRIGGLSARAARADRRVRVIRLRKIRSCEQRDGHVIIRRGDAVFAT
jgi:hypothetical protein